MTERLKQPWLVTAAITALGWIWVLAGERAVTRHRLDDVRRQVRTLQVDAAAAGERASDVRSVLAGIQTDVSWIRCEITRLREKQDASHEPR